MGKVLIKKYSEKEGEIVLLSANENYPDININEMNRFKIAGVVVSIIKIS